MSRYEGLHTGGLRTLGLVAVAGSLVLAAGGCGESTNPADSANLIVGKQQFVSKCGACHTLVRANTKGTVGPDLDEAFAGAVAEADGRHAIRGVVEFRIRHANPQGVMPSDLRLTRPRPSPIGAAYVAAAGPAPAKTPACSRARSRLRGPASPPKKGRQARHRRQPRRPARLHHQQGQREQRAG